MKTLAQIDIEIADRRADCISCDHLLRDAEAQSTTARIALDAASEAHQAATVARARAIEGYLAAPGEATSAVLEDAERAVRCAGLLVDDANAKQVHAAKAFTTARIALEGNAAERSILQRERAGLEAKIAIDAESAKLAGHLVAARDAAARIDELRAGAPMGYVPEGLLDGALDHFSNLGYGSLDSEHGFGSRSKLKHTIQGAGPLVSKLANVSANVFTMIGPQRTPNAPNAVTVCPAADKIAARPDVKAYVERSEQLERDHAKAWLPSIKAVRERFFPSTVRAGDVYGGQ